MHLHLVNCENRCHKIAKNPELSQSNSKYLTVFIKIVENLVDSKNKDFHSIGQFKKTFNTVLNFINDNL